LEELFELSPGLGTRRQRVAHRGEGQLFVVRSAEKTQQDHVHAGETGGGHVLLLPFERDVLAGLGGDLQQQRTGAAGGVVGGG
jgi:hypothetical protein